MLRDKFKKIYSIFTFTFSIVLSASFVLSAKDALSSDEDPLEPINRVVFGFNEVIDDTVLEPVANGYRAITPDPVETGVSNFFGNLGEVSTIANDVLQLKFGQAGNDILRFSIN